MKLVSEHNKLSLTECKKTLNTDGLFYTDAEIIELRDFLYHMADIVMDDIENEKSKGQQRALEPSIDIETKREFNRHNKKGIRILRAGLLTDIKIIDAGTASKTGSIRIIRTLFIIKKEYEKESHHIYPRFD